MKNLVGAAVGSCVHVAGVFKFIQMAEEEGYETTYMGGAVPLKELINAIKEIQPHMVSIGYRLSKESAEKILKELELNLREENLLDNIIYVFGGTIETAEVARKFSFISKIFDGSEEPEESILFLRNSHSIDKNNVNIPQQLRERINYKNPYPLFRHHIGLGTLEETEKAIMELAESNLLDIISLAPDQNCQQFFFNQQNMDRKQDGAGGAPIRKKEDLIRMYGATRRGNYPLLRCYSGTEGLLEFSKILKETINNAWAAIPLTWYSELDRRSNRKLEDAIRENQLAIKWNAENGIPVEINESHQWALRFAHDALEVALAYITAYNAKELKVKDFIMQFMLCTPPTISPKMDIAKMLAKIELLSELESDEFNIIRMIRTGLLSYPADMDAAKAQLASSIFYGSYLKPHIIHVVAYCEAVQRATPKEIIESVKIAKRSYMMAQQGIPDFASDKEVHNRKEQLKEEAMDIINSIIKIGEAYEKPLMEPKVISEAVKLGILDAPCLKGFGDCKGEVKVKIHNGAHVIVDGEGNIINEKKRIEEIFKRI
ncbi:cobalamin B12-binding domain-containing protein [Haloimpatiens massiliensis]|uniref:cobalamin B12-binding domain-containing protein n=1 Tax=Haloimpatiens massiliensis TaxID=1658110 RepID=UPI000C822DD0|nr:cobalamin B12-binding domain-containing protein [Haloimpatiens massiliensis]